MALSSFPSLASSSSGLRGKLQRPKGGTLMLHFWLFLLVVYARFSPVSSCQQRTSQAETPVSQAVFCMSHSLLYRGWPHTVSVQISFEYAVVSTKAVVPERLKHLMQDVVDLVS